MMALCSWSGWMSAKQAFHKFAGFWAVPEVLMKESQGGVCFLCDGVDVVGPLKVVKEM